MVSILSLYVYNSDTITHVYLCGMTSYGLVTQQAISDIILYIHIYIYNHTYTAISIQHILVYTIYQYTLYTQYLIVQYTIYYIIYLKFLCRYSSLGSGSSRRNSSSRGSGGIVILSYTNSDISCESFALSRLYKAYNSIIYKPI